MQWYFSFPVPLPRVKRLCCFQLRLDENISQTIGLIKASIKAVSSCLERIHGYLSNSLPGPGDAAISRTIKPRDVRLYAGKSCFKNNHYLRVITSIFVIANIFVI